MKKKSFLLSLIIFIGMICMSVLVTGIETKEESRIKDVSEVTETDENGAYVILTEKDEKGNYVVKSHEKKLLQNNLMNESENKAELSNNEISLFAATPEGCLDVVNAELIGGWV